MWEAETWGWLNTLHTYILTCKTLHWSLSFPEPHTITNMDYIRVQNVCPGNQGNHQIANCSKHSFGYFNTLETHSDYSWCFATKDCIKSACQLPVTSQQNADSTINKQSNISNKAIKEKKQVKVGFKTICQTIKTCCLLSLKIDSIDLEELWFQINLTIFDPDLLLWSKD